MKKVYTALMLMIVSVMTAVSGYAVPDEPTIIVSQDEIIDYVILLGAAIFLLGLLFVLLSLYAGVRKKKLDEYDEEIILDYEPEDYEEEPEVDEPDEAEDGLEPEPIFEVAAEETVEPEIEPEPEVEAEPEPVVEEKLIRITLTGTNNPDVRFAEFARQCTLGRRNTNDIMISDNAVSGNHCEFICEDDKIIIRDLDSTNGTLLNGEPVTTAEINSGDLIIVGKLQYRISIMK